MEQNASESKGNAMRGLAALKQASVSLARRHQNLEQATRPAGEVGEVPALPTTESIPSATTSNIPSHHVSDTRQPLSHTASLANRGSTKKIPDPSELRLMENPGEAPSEGQSAAPPITAPGMATPPTIPAGHFRAASQASGPESTQVENWEHSPLNRFLKEKLKTNGNFGQSVVTMTEQAEPASAGKPRAVEPASDKTAARSPKVEQHASPADGLAVSPPPAATPKPIPADTSPLRVHPLDSSPPASKVATAPPDNAPHWVQVAAKQLLRPQATLQHTHRDANHAFGGIPSHLRRKQPESVKDVPFVSESVSGPKLSVPVPLEPNQPLSAAKILTPPNLRSSAAPVVAKAKAPANPFQDSPGITKPVLRSQPSPVTGGAPHTIKTMAADTKRTESIANQEDVARHLPSDIQRKQGVSHVSALLNELADTMPAREPQPVASVKPAAPPMKDHSATNKAPTVAAQRKQTVTLGQEKPKPKIAIKPDQKKDVPANKPPVPPTVPTTKPMVPTTPARNVPKGVLVQATSLPKNHTTLQATNPGGVSQHQGQRPRPLPQPVQKTAVPQHAEHRTGTSAPQKSAPSRYLAETKAISSSGQTSAMGSLVLPGGTVRIPSSTKITINPGPGKTQTKTQSRVPEAAIAGPARSGAHPRPDAPPPKAARLIVTIPAKEDQPAGQTKVPMSGKPPKGYQRTSPNIVDPGRPRTNAGPHSKPDHSTLEAVPQRNGNNNAVEVWQVPVEGLGKGIVHLLGDAVGGVVSLVSGSQTKKKRTHPQPTRKPTSPSVPRAVATHKPSAGLQVATGKLSGGVRGILTGVAQIASGSIDVVLGSLGTLGGVIIHTAGKMGIKSKH
ncbi:MAG: hypothetical protein HQL79_08390 [Magnetococcales bacterium]|nr:hypothetical protein [Magnetococcales bacterium]